MKLASIQPYFFPYLGYFCLLNNVDIFILNDSVQFIHQGWIERNRILHQVTGWLYIRVPLVSHRFQTLIKDIQIDNSKNWKQKILSQLHHYKKTAPFYFEVISLLKELFERDYRDIVSLNRDSLVSVCNYLKIKNEIFIFSEMNLSIETPKVPDEWGLNICKSIGNISEFWNPPSGHIFYDKSKYEKANLGIKFLEMNLTPYEQKRNVFEPALSIIDVMMFNSPETIRQMLNEYHLT